MPVKDLSLTKDILRFEGPDKQAYWRRFAMLLSLATVMATMGLLRDSGAVVIAAMLVAPMMTPILGIASSMVMGSIGRSIRLLFIVCTASALVVVMAWALVSIADVPRGIVVPDQVLARTDPGLEDLLVALAAGVAGAYVQIQKSAISLLPGAAIGVSLVPPLSAAGILLYFGETPKASEAALLFTTNLGAIILSACAVYLFSGALSAVLRKDKRRRNFSISVVLTMALVAAVTFQLLQATYQRYLETRTETRLARAIEAMAAPTPIEILRIDVNSSRKHADIWLIVDLPWETQDRIASTADLLPQNLRDAPVDAVLTEVLGPDFEVALRYNTRISLFGKLGTGAFGEPPAGAPASEN